VTGEEVIFQLEQRHRQRQKAIDSHGGAVPIERLLPPQSHHASERERRAKISGQ